ncbi:MAG TPA: TetR/AcrR family transcriptional regulator [Deltaproteobacteria bacterium]|nr:TetR/AcrR family transcriptional regulator [Deltaproteobacteria bacterium]
MITKARKTWERERRLERIIDIAQELMLKKGGRRGIAVEDIARAAGYNKRTIYLYFGGKDELFLAVVLRGQKILKEALQAALDDKTETPAIERLARAFFDFSIRHSGFFPLIMEYESRVHVYYGNPVDVDPASFRARCRQESNDYGQIVTDAIERDLSAGIIESSLAPRQLMILLWGQVFGVMQIILMRQTMFYPTYGISYEELFEYFLAMVLTRLSPIRRGVMRNYTY